MLLQGSKKKSTELREGFGTTNSDCCSVSEAARDVIILKSEKHYNKALSLALFLKFKNPSLTHLILNKNYGSLKSLLWFCDAQFWWKRYCN